MARGGTRRGPTGGGGSGRPARVGHRHRRLVAAGLLLSKGLAPEFLGLGMATALLAAVTATALGWDEDVRSDVALAGLFADIGMITVPWDVAHKPGELTRLERRSIERHAQAGAELLSPVGRAAPLVPLVAQQHHERVDGSGYPSGLAGRHVRPETQVIAVAHRYLAMSTARRHRKPMTPHVALANLTEQSDRLASATIVEAFATAVAPYPLGSFVRLVDGRAGRVQAATAEKLEVEILVDAEGEPITPLEQAVGLAEVAAAA